MSRALNFYPYYEPLLKVHTKYTTIRLGDIQGSFHVGDMVTITIGWNESDAIPLCKAKITSIVHKRINEISKKDLEGESPDCYKKEAVKYVLSAIYRKVVKDDDFITIIRWKYL